MREHTPPTVRLYEFELILHPEKVNAIKLLGDSGIRPEMKPLIRQSISRSASASEGHPSFFREWHLSPLKKQTTQFSTVRINLAGGAGGRML